MKGISNSNFLYLRERLTEERFQMADDKSVEYTQGSNDRLINFTRTAEDTGLPWVKVWYFPFKKHLDSLIYWMKNDGKVHLIEGIKQKIFDIQNYLDLLLARIEVNKGKV